MSTSSTTRAKSTTKAANGGGSKGVQRGAASPVSAFPPALPIKFRNLIDGKNVLSIEVSYTKYGTTVMVVRGDLSKVPLEQYEAWAKAQAKQNEFQKEFDLYRDRITGRGLSAPAEAQRINVVDPQSLKAYLEAWARADPETHKILLMTNRNFRAQQGANAAPSNGTA
jgi:hypothetical protein